MVMERYKESSNIPAFVTLAGSAQFFDIPAHLLSRSSDPSVSILPALLRTMFNTSAAFRASLDESLSRIQIMYELFRASIMRRRTSALVAALCWFGDRSAAVIS